MEKWAIDSVCFRPGEREASFTIRVWDIRWRIVWYESPGLAKLTELLSLIL